MSGHPMVSGSGSQSVPQSQPSRHRSKWSLDFSSHSLTASITSASQPVGYSSHMAVAVHNEAQRSASNQNQLRMKRSWDLALGPIKQLPMNLLIMYMSGNTISIFPIMMVIMMAIRPLKTLFSVNATFKTLDAANENSGGNIGQKIVYVLGNLANVVLAMYKCHGMGLLPTHASDWLAFADPIQRAEWAYVAV